MPAYVVAKKEIRTDKGFKIADKGDKGVAVRGATPYFRTNLGRVMVRFNGRKHGYWCMPDEIGWTTDVRTENYIASSEPFDPYAGALKIPHNDNHCRYHFGTNLQILRKSRRITQAEMGDRMGRHGLTLSQSTISYRERRPFSPNGKFVDVAAKVLNVPAWVFFLNLADNNVFPNAREYLASLSACVCQGE